MVYVANINFLHLEAAKGIIFGIVVEGDALFLLVMIPREQHSCDTHFASTEGIKGAEEMEG